MRLLRDCHQRLSLRLRQSRNDWKKLPRCAPSAWRAGDSHSERPPLRRRLAPISSDASTSVNC